MTLRNLDWLDWQIAIWEGKVKFHPNGHINWLMSHPSAIALYTRLHQRPSHD